MISSDKELTIISQGNKNSWIMFRFPPRSREWKSKALFCLSVWFFRLKVIEWTVQQLRLLLILPHLLLVYLGLTRKTIVCPVESINDIAEAAESNQLFVDKNSVSCNFFLQFLPLFLFLQVLTHTTKYRMAQIIWSPLQLMRWAFYCAQLQIRFCKWIRLLFVLIGNFLSSLTEALQLLPVIVDWKDLGSLI